METAQALPPEELGLVIPVLEEVVFPKQKVAKEIGIHYNTVTTWDTIAFFRVPHYRKCYEISPGKYNRRQPLVKYQVWVLKRIQHLFSRLKNTDRVRTYLTAYSHEFTFQAFQQEKQL